MISFVDENKYLTSYEAAKSEYPIPLFLYKRLTTLAGTNFNLSFIMQQISAQGKHRMRDINIALGVLSSAVCADIITEALINSRVLPSRIQVKLRRILPHLRTANLGVGVVLELFRSLAFLIAQDANKTDNFLIDFSDWLNNESPWLRAGISAALIALTTTGLYYLSERDQFISSTSTPRSPERTPLLLSPGASPGLNNPNTRPINKYARALWYSRVPVIFTVQLVCTLLALVIFDSYGANLDSRAETTLVILLASLATLVNLVQDHPKVKNSALGIKQGARFLDKLFKAFCYQAIMFSFFMNLMSLYRHALHFSVDKSTAFSIELAITFLSLHLVEVLWRVAKVANDENAIVERFIKTWDFVREFAKAATWGLQVSDYSPYSFIVSPLVAVVAFLMKNVDKSQTEIWKLYVRKIPKNINHSLFIASMLPALLTLNHLAILPKDAIIFPAAAVHLAAKYSERKYPKIKYGLNIIDTALITSGLYYSVKHFALPFGATVPTYIQYIMLATAVTLMLVKTGGELLHEYTAPNTYASLNSSFTELGYRSAIAKWAPYVNAGAKASAAGAALIIGSGEINKFAQIAMDAGDRIETGNAEVLILLGLCTSIMMYTLYKRYTSDLAETKRESRDNFYAKLLGCFGLCNGKNSRSEEFIADQQAYISDTPEYGL